MIIASEMLSSGPYKSMSSVSAVQVSSVSVLQVQALG